MDSETKAFLGRLFGEVFRLQKRADKHMCDVSEADVYGLLHGFEEAFDSVFEGFEPITKEEVEVVEQFLDRAEKSGGGDYWDLNDRGGTDKMRIMRIFKYLNLKTDGSYDEVFKKIRMPSEFAMVTRKLGQTEK